MNESQLRCNDNNNGTVDEDKGAVRKSRNNILI